MRNKILVMVLFIFVLLGLNTVISYGAISASSKTVNSGENVTISVSSSEVLGAYTIKVIDNGGLTFVSSSSKNGQANGTIISGSSPTGIKDNLGEFTFKTPSVSKDTTYYVKIQSSGTEGPNLENINGSTATATIVVKAPVQPSPVVKPSPSTPTNPSPAAPTFSSVNETVYATNDVFVRSSYSTSSSSLGQLKKGESIIRVGISTTKVNGYYWSKVTYNGKTGYIASNYLTTTKPAEDPSPLPSSQPEEKSKDATLKSLTITGLELTPVFDSTITSYVVNTKENMTEVEVLAEVNDTKAKVEIIGAKELKEGENLIIVKVTAEDGTTKDYEIKLIIGEQKIPLNAFVILGIKENGEQLEIELGNPIVSENTVEYIINLEEWLKSINILGSLNNETYQYEGIGAFDLVVGENKYTIILKELQENAEANQIEYKITINNPEKVIIVEETNETNYKIAIAISAIVLVTILAITGLIVYYKKQNKVEYAKTDYSFLKKDEESQNKENEQDIEERNVSNDNEDGKKKGGKHF